MSGNVIDVNQGNFQQEVIRRSHKVPVVVDFWAPWCGPCRMLGPILERLANEPGSNFILAKLNTDQNQAIAGQYGIRGIPAVKAFRNGEVVEEFVGAQPEPNVRAFLQRVTAGARPRPQRQARRPAEPAADPTQRLQQARQALTQGNGCEAQRLLKDFPAGSQASEANQLRPLADFMCNAPRTGQANVDTLYDQALSALRRRDYSAALYQLLSARNQAAPADKSRVQQVMQGVFALLGDTDPIVAQYKNLV